MNEVFEGKLFKVTPLFVEGERYIEILRPLTIEDFSFSQKENDQESSFHLVISGNFLPEIKQELATVFPASSCNPRFNRYYRQACESIARGNFLSYENFSIDYRGCRDEKGRQAKLAREFPVLKAELLAKSPAMRQDIVDSVNKMTERLVAECNDSYRSEAIRVMTWEPWKGLDEAADTVGLLARLQEARDTIKSLKEQITKRRNDHMMGDFGDNHKVDCDGETFVIAKPVAEEINLIYCRGDAFQQSERMIY